MRVLACAAALCVAMLAAAAGPWISMHRPVSTIYDIYVGGIRAGELTLDARFEGDSYRATSMLRTAGLPGAIYQASFRAEVDGTVGANGLAPRRFAADTRAEGEAQAVEVTYDGRAPAEVRADPPFKPKPWEIDPRQQAGTLDPISAAVTALTPAPKDAICSRTVDIFDGRRRYAIDLGAPQVDGERIRCRAVYRRVAGFKAKEMKETIPFNIWFEARPDGLAHVVRAAGESLLGVAVLLLRE